MSTRSTTHFTYNGNKTAIVYRHSDGYPSGAGADIKRFLELIGKLRDKRWNDPSYLAAKYIVFLATEFAKRENEVTAHYNPAGVPPDDAKHLNFLGVGVMMDDPGDIEYRYVIDCKQIGPDGPKVTCFDIDSAGDKELPCYYED